MTIFVVYNNSAGHILPPEVPSESPPYVIRVLLIYGRSYCEPTYNITTKVCQSPSTHLHSILCLLIDSKRGFYITACRS